LPQHAQITEHSSNVPIHRLLRPKKIFWRLQDYVRAKAQTESTHFDNGAIWHATYFQLPKWWKGPKLVTVYDLVYEKYPQLFNKGYDDILRERKKRAILAADKVICISESVQADVFETYGISRDRIVSIPLACGDNFRQIPKEEIPSDFRVDRPFILYIGRRSQHKNFKTLLNAYAAWSHRDEISLLVVGNSWSKEEQAEIVSHGLLPNILLRSGVADEELCALYNQALAFVYPSLSEGFGIPLLEAMSCGCPIVASRIPTTMEVARNAPYYFDPLNKDDLIMALESACFSEKLKIRNDILKEYSWDRNARATLKIYEELALHA